MFSKNVLVSKAQVLMDAVIYIESFVCFPNIEVSRHALNAEKQRCD